MPARAGGANREKSRLTGYNAGNKRIGFVTAILFLELNGKRFIAPEAEATLKTLALAPGELDKAD